MKALFWYFVLSLPLKVDLIVHGPVTRLVAAATGLPIE